MLLTYLSLSQFRNFARLELDIPGGPVLLVGANAQGKTSLLEAIFYLATFDSFQTALDRQLINFWVARKNLAVARLQGEFHATPSVSGKGGGIHRLEVRLIQEVNELGGDLRFRKEILLDGVKTRAAEATGIFKAVLFQPQMLSVIEGAPEERRRFLNLAMSQVVPQYASILADYQRALSMRNALLRQLSERQNDPRQLDFLDQELARLGGMIMQARIRAILELERYASRTHLELTRDQERLRLVYQPSYRPFSENGQRELPLDDLRAWSQIPLERIQLGLAEAYAQARFEEIERGVTSIGPHRDEMRFFSNQIDLGVYGSRGQQRTAMLSLKLAELHWMKGASGQWPVFLLDEILAELDADRRNDVLRRLLECEQTFLTTTDLEMFPPAFIQRTQVWQLGEGVIKTG